MDTNIVKIVIIADCNSVYSDNILMLKGKTFLTFLKKNSFSFIRQWSDLINNERLLNKVLLVQLLLLA